MSVLLPVIAGSALGVVFSKKNKAANRAYDESINPDGDIRSTRQFLLQRPKANAELSAVSGWGLNTRVAPHPGSQPYFNRTYAEESAARAALYYSRNVEGYIPIQYRGHQPVERPSLA